MKNKIMQAIELLRQKGYGNKGYTINFTKVDADKVNLYMESGDIFKVDLPTGTVKHLPSGNRRSDWITPGGEKLPWDLK